jgi:undecaprenyl-diphosphatase
MDWFESLILGVVQGITEFLPVSSDGHLAITQQAFAWLTGHSRSGQEDLFFDIMLHAGTLAAILFYFRSMIAQGARGFLLGATDVRPGLDRASVVRSGLLAAVATSPLVPFALFFKKRLEEMFQSTQAAGVGFLITAAVLFSVGARMKGPEGGKGLAQTSWLDALLIGIAQMFAPLPGVSRSGLTIAAALALGLSRTWSVGFSLLIAVPAICGAVVFELKDVVKDHQALGLTPDRIEQTVAATVVAGLVGYFAILWLFRVVQARRLWYFSVYLTVLGFLTLALSAISGGSPDARPAKALDRSAGRRDPGPLTGGPGGPSGGPLDHADVAGARPGCPRADTAGPGWPTGIEGLLLGRSLALRAMRGRGWPALALEIVRPHGLS